MEHSCSILKLETETQPGSVNYMCIRCGKQFNKPIFAVNNSPGVAEAYYACPACLSKVEIRKEEKKAESKVEAPHEPDPATIEEQVEAKPEPKPAPPTPAAPSVCAHYKGYLKNRPKNTPVPEECFTCTLMLDCMSR